MEAYLEEFMEYLTEEQGKAKNTREAYRRDLLEFQRRLAEKEIIGLEKATNTEVWGICWTLRIQGNLRLL